MDENRPQKEQTRLTIGNEEALVVQKRDMLLMQALAFLRIVDRQQASRIAGFHSATRVNTRLLRLTRAGLLKRFFFVGTSGGKRAVYCLSKKGADFAAVVAKPITRPSDSFLLGDKFVAHQLAINDVYCAAQIGSGKNGTPDVHWQAISEPLAQTVPIVPDAYVEIRAHGVIRPMFLEVDLGTEGLPVWSKKTQGYLTFASSGEFERSFQHPRFGVTVVTISEKRMKSLRSQIARSTQKLFYFSTLERIKIHGFWSPVWLRPEGDQMQSLI